MRRSFLLMAAMMLWAATMLTSCKYKDLCYDHSHGEKTNMILRLDLQLDLDIDVIVTEESHTKIKLPSHMVVCFYDTLTGALKEMEIVGTYGGPLHVNPGVYNMIVYSFDTEWTQVQGDGNINTLEAFTSDITELKAAQFALFKSPKEENEVDSVDTDAPGPIIYTPDHLLVTHKQIEIPPYSIEDQVITIEAKAKTIAQTYNFEVTNVEGIEYISKVDAFVTNQARSSFFGRGEVNDEPATLYFEMEVDKDSLTLKTSFNTFGKLPGESKSYLNLLVTDSEGKAYTIVTDITDQFNNPEHTIVVQDTIIVPPPTESGGGIAPTVDPWEEENHDVQIG